MDRLAALRKANQIRVQQDHEETRALIDEYEALKGTDKPSNIAQRMGYNKPPSLARRFQRNGRPDLTKGLWTPTNRQKG